jgi:hypothetical protein
LLSWANVTNVSAVDSAGVASYRFFFFDAGERRESVVFYGPELDLYPTPTPTPSYGGGDGGGVGISPKEIVEDVKEQLLEDKDLQSELAGKLRRFLPAYEGIKHPEIISATVTPERGSWNESYDYWVEVVHPNRADMWLTLEVYCPSKGVNCTNKTRKINSSMYDESNIATVEWRDVKVFCEADVKAAESPKYYIQYNDSCNYGSREFTGPKLNSAPVLSYPMVIPESGTYGDLFVYKVNVSDEDGDDVWVTLHIINSAEVEISRETHVISGIESKMGMTESWIYNFTEEKVSKNLSFFFTATDGIDYAKKVDGEDLDINPSRPEREQALPRGLSLLVIEALVVTLIALNIISLIRKYHKSIAMFWYKIRRKRLIEEEIV